MNKLGRGQQEDAIYQICLLALEKENFEVEIICSYILTCDPRGGANFDPIDTV